MKYIKRFENLNLSDDVDNCLNDVRDYGSTIEHKICWLDPAIKINNLNNVDSIQNYISAAPFEGRYKVHQINIIVKGLKFEDFPELIQDYQIALDRLKEIGKIHSSFFSQSKPDSKVNFGSIVWVITTERSNIDIMDKLRKDIIRLGYSIDDNYTKEVEKSRMELSANRRQFSSQAAIISRIRGAGSSGIIVDLGDIKITKKPDGTMSEVNMEREMIAEYRRKENKLRQDIIKDFQGSDIQPTVSTLGVISDLAAGAYQGSFRKVLVHAAGDNRSIYNNTYNEIMDRLYDASDHQDDFIDDIDEYDPADFEVDN